MHTRKEANEAVSSFLRTEERFLLLTGTHQYEKHVLALNIILSEYPSPAQILFRVNHSSSIDSFLSPVLDLAHELKIGTPTNIQGGYTLYVDTINPTSWRSSPYEIDVAAVYPIDSLEYDAGDDCVQDLIRRKAKKILLVSWTDDRDFGWVDQFNPVRVVFDAEEENPEYHKRVLESIGQFHVDVISEKLPKYAQSTPQSYLVKILCRGRCHAGRWARLNLPYPGKSALKSAQMGQYRATCLQCGYEATDNYNWFR